jgi:two-component sensor histidine kinase
MSFFKDRMDRFQESGAPYDPSLGRPHGQEATTAVTLNFPKMPENRQSARLIGSAPGSLSDPERLRRALSAARVGAWEWHLPDDTIHVDASVFSLLGLAPQLGSFHASQLFNLMDSEEVGLLRIAMAEALRSDDEFVRDMRLYPGDRVEPIWLCSQARVVERDECGTARVMAGIVFNVTERRRVQEQQELVNRELSHRMKNVLSVVNSLVTMTAEHRPEAEEFMTSFRSRLAGLGTAHELLFRGDWDAVPLLSLIERSMVTLGVSARVDVIASDVTLSPRDTQTLVLVLHELATNAIKYGSLSNASGRVKVDCELAEGAHVDMQVLRIVWKESGGPEVTAPLTKGFGVTLLERLTRRQSAPGQLFEWRPGGLLCRFELRIAA